MAFLTHNQENLLLGLLKDKRVIQAFDEIKNKEGVTLEDLEHAIKLNAYTEIIKEDIEGFLQNDEYFLQKDEEEQHEIRNYILRGFLKVDYDPNEDIFTDLLIDYRENEVD